MWCLRNSVSSSAVRGKNSPCPPITLIIQPQQKLDKADDVFRCRECGESPGTGPRIQAPHNSGFLLPTLKVKGDPSVVIEPRQECLLGSASCRMGLYQERCRWCFRTQQAVLIQLQTFTILTQVFSGRNSLKLLKRNLKSCCKAKEMFLFFTGWKASCLSLFYVCFRKIKQRKRG